MKIPFPLYHLLQFFEGYALHTLPLDLSLHHYFRAHKSLGSKDRAFIAEHAYGIIRWQGFLDHFLKKPFSWEDRYSVFTRLSQLIKKQANTLPSYIAVSFPKPLFEEIVEAYGEKRAKEICLASNTVAPTTVRVNLLKTTREKLLKEWSNTYDVVKGEVSPTAITFRKRLNFFTLPQFKAGCFEVQDEGSQLLAQLVDAKPGDHVLDYCAGSGGKTLAIAPAMQGKGQLYLHDIRPKALMEAKKRLKRAGIQNAQLMPPEHRQLKKLKGHADWVLTDVPCSGTGTLRRNPDMKWKINEEMLEELVEKQRYIFGEALSYLKPGGKIVYSTCSLLPRENERQVEHFLQKYSLEIVGKPFQSVPEEGKMDGFFGVVLQEKSR